MIHNVPRNILYGWSNIMIFYKTFNCIEFYNDQAMEVEQMHDLNLGLRFNYYIDINNLRLDYS